MSLGFMRHIECVRGAVGRALLMLLGPETI